MADACWGSLQAGPRRLRFSARVTSSGPSSVSAVRWRVLWGNYRRLEHMTTNGSARWVHLVVNRTKPVELRPSALGMLRYDGHPTGPAVALGALVPVGDWRRTSLIRCKHAYSFFFQRGLVQFDLLKQIIAE